MIRKMLSKEFQLLMDKYFANDLAVRMEFDERFFSNHFFAEDELNYMRLKVENTAFNENVPALTLRAVMIYFGQGYSRNHEAGLALLDEAIVLKDPIAMTHLAILYTCSDDRQTFFRRAISCSRAIPLLDYAIESKLPAAMRMRAVLYLSGRGEKNEKPNYLKGEPLLREASRLGDGIAKTLVAYIFEEKQRAEEDRAFYQKTNVLTQKLLGSKLTLDELSDVLYQKRVNYIAPKPSLGSIFMSSCLGTRDKLKKDLPASTDGNALNVKRS
jgi:hypothetical protein